MKRLMVCFTLFLLTLSACKKDDDDNGAVVTLDDPPKVRYFEYKVDGVEHRRDSILNDTMFVVDGNSVFIDLKEEVGGKRLLFYVNSFNGEQEYFDVYVQRNNGSNLTCIDTIGAFVNIYNIDKENNYVEGSFSADCDDLIGKDITDGVFLIDYFD